ncbi:MAG: GIY-YIG nuclease family protein [Gemmatimonadetes bacterium]|nr:GIY-YIG nuclease family protein [Gemmatimonadota bacterium]
MSVSSTSQHPFYVYHLRDPRDGVVFYVGKGKGGRMHSHARSARRGWIDNPAKVARIREIHAAGLEVDCLKVHEHLSEPEAFRLELKEIESIGLGRLTNVAPGTLSPAQSDRIRASLMFTRLTSFPEWCALRSRTVSERALYQRLVREMTMMIAEPCEMTSARSITTELRVST